VGAKKKAVAANPKDVARQVEGFIDKFEPTMAKRIREVRKAVRKRLPTTVEMAWDNYNFFVLGYSVTDRPSDSLIALAANSKGVGLSFYRGSDLADPEGILEGAGTQNRFVRLVEGAKTLQDPKVEAMIERAVENSKLPLPEGKGYTVVRSIAVKQRPRR